jgi:hypothetical protein
MPLLADARGASAYATRADSLCTAASDQQVVQSVPVSTGFVESGLSVPRLNGTLLHAKLRDDPSVVNKVVLPSCRIPRATDLRRDGSGTTVSPRLPGLCDEVPHALCKFDDFAFTSKFEIDLIMARRCVIYSLSELEQGLHHLARQYKANSGNTLVER